MTPKALFSELLYDSHSERWNEFELPKLSLGELQALCKLLGCPCYGTKETLVVRGDRPRNSDRGNALPQPGTVRLRLRAAAVQLHHDAKFLLCGRVRTAGNGLPGKKRCHADDQIDRSQPMVGPRTNPYDLVRTI